MNDQMTTSDTGDPVALGLGGQLKAKVTVAMRVLDRLLDAEFSRLGVSLVDADALTVLLLAENRVASPTDMASWLGLTTAGMTARLNALEQRGLLERRPHPTDGRRVIVHFTDAGEALARRVLARKGEVLADRLVSGLGEELSQRLVVDLGELIRVASAASGGPRSV